MNIIETRWIPARDLIGTINRIGVVAIRREDGWKAFILGTDGEDEERNKQEVAMQDTTLPEASARAFFPQLKDEKYAS